MPKNIFNLKIDSVDSKQNNETPQQQQTNNQQQEQQQQQPAQQQPLQRNDSKKFLDNKSQSVSSKPRPPPLPPIIQATSNASPATGAATAAMATNGSSAAASDVSKSDTQITNQNNNVKRSGRELREMIEKMEITKEQKAKLMDFLKTREDIGELTNDDLSVEGELGSGNGGVVLKVRHRRLGVVMAKKVSASSLVTFDICSLTRTSLFMLFSFSSFI
jgi:hypothetical protein